MAIKIIYFVHGTTTDNQAKLCSGWKETYEKRIKENRYFAYIKDNDIDEFVGFIIEKNKFG